MANKPIDKNKAYGLVFAGGGTRGCYEIGAWKALNELNVKIKAVAGTSIGAINGALFVQNDFDLAYKIWTNVKMEDIIATDENPIKAFLFTIKEKGLDISPLKEIMNKYLDEDRIRASEIDYGLVTFSVSDIEPVTVMKKNIPKGKLVDYILASASLFVFQPTVIDGKTFIDGGIYDNAPAFLLQEADCHEIIVIKIPGLTGYRNYTIRKTDKASLYIIENSSELCGLLEFDNAKIRDGIEMGYLDTKRAFGELYGSVYYISHGLNEYADSRFLYPMTEEEFTIISEDIQKDQEGAEKNSRELLIKTLNGYSDDQINFGSALQAFIEIAAGIFEIDRLKVYSGDELYEEVLKEYVRFKESVEYLESKKSILSLYKALDFNSISKKNLAAYFISLSEKDKVSKKYLLKFMPKVYTTYLFFEFMKNRDARIKD